ncbi:15890_t:CDS:2, partial [Rhizophagus irregularis]
MINSIEPINNNQQIIQQLKLNHGLLLNGYNVQPSSQAIFKEDGELKVKLYNRQPIVYADISFLLDNLFIDKDNYDNTLQPSNMCINFPIAEITYKGELLKSFSECMNDNNANSHTLGLERGEKY